MKVIALTAALAVLATPAFAGDNKAQIQGYARRLDGGLQRRRRRRRR